MAKGRKRLPTELKRVQGTLQPCRTNDNEPDYVLTKEIPDPPKYLSKTGRDVYYSTAEELLKLGILTRVSMSLFVMYCTQVAIYFHALEQIDKNDYIFVTKGGDEKPNPYIKIANDALAASVRIACEFGITPASSSKVYANKVETNPKADLIKRLQKR